MNLNLTRGFPKSRYTELEGLLTELRRADRSHPGTRRGEGHRSTAVLVETAWRDYSEAAKSVAILERTTSA